MIDDVTYVDRDRRAARFFADVDGVTELVAEHSQDADASTWRFIHADYRHTVPVLDARFDLLIPAVRLAGVEPPHPVTSGPAGSC